MTVFGGGSLLLQVESLRSVSALRISSLISFFLSSRGMLLDGSSFVSRFGNGIKLDCLRNAE